MKYHKKLKKLKKKLALFSCGCFLLFAVVAGIVLIGAITGIGKSLPGWLSQVRSSLPKDLRLPAGVELPNLPENPFKLSQAEQVRLGREVAASEGLDQGAFESKTINEVASRLIRALPPKYKGPAEIGGWKWRCRAVRTKDGVVNAIALPGGTIYVYDGLMKLAAGNPDQLAAVIGHEMAHIVEEHSAEQLFTAGLLQQATQLVLQQAGGDGENPQGEVVTVLAARMGKQITQMQLSQKAEYQADDIGFQIMARAGYNPREGLNILKKLDKLSRTNDSILRGVFSTHPPTKKRIQKLQESMDSYKAAHTTGG